MKKREIKLGGIYTAKVSGKLTIVRVDQIREESQCRNVITGRISRYPSITAYDVTNLTTNRKITFRSAAKFRRAAI